MAFTTEHYCAVAEVLAGDVALEKASVAWSAAQTHRARGITLSLCQMFKRDNPRFDQRKFLEACGFDETDAPTVFAGTGAGT